MADHNDPNAVNSIFSDIDVSAADLYDLFGFPSADTNGGEKVVIALTFASVPEPGLLDHDMLYRIQICAEPRVGQKRSWALESFSRNGNGTRFLSRNEKKHSPGSLPYARYCPSGDQSSTYFSSDDCSRTCSSPAPVAGFTYISMSFPVR